MMAPVSQEDPWDAVVVTMLEACVAAQLRYRDSPFSAWVDANPALVLSTMTRGFPRLKRALTKRTESYSKPEDAWHGCRLGAGDIIQAFTIPKAPSRRQAKRQKRRRMKS